MFYLEEVLDPETQTVVIQQSSRPLKDTDWPLYNKAKEDYHSSLQQYQQHRQALSYLPTLMTTWIILSNFMLVIPKPLWILILTNYG